MTTRSDVKRNALDLIGLAKGALKFGDFRFWVVLLLLASIAWASPDEVNADEAPTLIETLGWIQRYVDGTEVVVPGTEVCPVFLKSIDFSWRQCTVSWKTHGRTSCDGTWDTTTYSVDLSHLDPGLVLPPIFDYVGVVVETTNRRESIEELIVGVDPGGERISRAFKARQAVLVVPQALGVRMTNAMMLAIELCGGKRSEDVF